MTCEHRKTKRARFWVAALAILIVTVVSACGPGTLRGGQLAPPPQVAGYKLAFHDEFDAVDISHDGSGAHTWYEGVWFNNRHAPLTNISGSNSTISLDWRRGQDSLDTSVSTLARDKQHFHAWRYGYIEARMKWDVLKGAWVGFWLIPVEDATGHSVYNGTTESGEVDVFEGLGETPHEFYGTVHDWVNFKDSANKNNRFRLSDGISLSEYHTYALLWVPGTVTWYLDNQVLHSEKTPAVFDKQKYFIVFSVQEGVDWKAGVLSGVTANKITLTVDWVRVWQK